MATLSIKMVSSDYDDTTNKVLKDGKFLVCENDVTIAEFGGNGDKAVLRAKEFVAEYQRSGDVVGARAVAYAAV